MIKLGYEIETGKQIDIEPSHLLVTGLTQKAGKTTTLESLIARSKKKAIVFRTKVGEKSFLSGTIIPPFFKDRSDWQFVKSLFEATINSRVSKIEQAKIIQICKLTSGNSLLDFKKKVDEKLAGAKIASFELDIFTNLQAYLDIVIPKLQTIRFSNKLELVDGLNIIDLERFSRDPEVQSLVIRSVLEEVLYNFKDVITIIPEAWKFIPQDRGNPCKLMVEEFIRQGATNHNYLWIDSQDMAAVDKTPLKQITEWILGYQAEKNEVKHTLDQMPLPKDKKPKEDDIMNLGTGVFYFASRDLKAKVYVQPFWLDDERAIKIAKGELKVEEIDAPQNLAQFRMLQPEKVEPQAVAQSGPTNQELTELRTDFFNKIDDMQRQVIDIVTDIFNLKNSQKDVDINAIVAKVLQKIPLPKANGPVAVDMESIIAEVLKRVPKGGSVTYTISPLEKIQKDFLEEAKQHILSGASTLSENAKKMLKYLEVQGRGCKPGEIITKCFIIKEGGSAREKVTAAALELLTPEFIRKDSSGAHFGELKSRIKSLMGNHNATDAEIENVYQHILMEML